MSGYVALRLLSPNAVVTWFVTGSVVFQDRRLQRMLRTFCGQRLFLAPGSVGGDLTAGGLGAYELQSGRGGPVDEQALAAA